MEEISRELLASSGVLFCGIGGGPVVLHSLLDFQLQYMGIGAILSELGSTSADEIFRGIAVVRRDDPSPMATGP